MIWLVAAIALLMAIYGETPYNCATYSWPLGGEDNYMIVETCGYGTVKTIFWGDVVMPGPDKVRVGRAPTL